MARTTVNVVGNCLAAAVVGRWEGELGTLGTPAPEEAGPTLGHPSMEAARRTAT
jgi:Na+/H+-dicarboxylate symporter